MVHLDTSFLIRALVRGSAQDLLLREWLDEGEVLRMSAIAWTEFLCGPITALDQELAGQWLVAAWPSLTTRPPWPLVFSTTRAGAAAP